MRIALDLSTSAKPNPQGIAYIGRVLTEALLRQGPEHDFVLVIRHNRWLRRKHLANLAPHLPRRLLWDPLAGLPLRDVDVLHGYGIRLPPAGHCPTSFILHDVNVFEMPELSTEHWRRVRSARIEQTLDRCTVAVATTRRGIEAVRSHLDVPEEKLRVIPLGIDPAIHHVPDPEAVADLRKRFDLDDRPYVLTLGGFKPRKNQQAMLAAMLRAGLGDEWLAVLGGPRGDGADAVRAAADDLGFPQDRLRLPGWIDAGDLAALIGGADVYCCPSQHEGFGMPVIEAQACGTAVVASNRGGLPDSVGAVGLLADPDDGEAFAAALRRMVTDGTFRGRCESEGVTRVERDYTWDRVAQRYLALWAEMAGG